MIMQPVSKVQNLGLEKKKPNTKKFYKTSFLVKTKVWTFETLVLEKLHFLVQLNKNTSNQRMELNSQLSQNYIYGLKE